MCDISNIPAILRHMMRILFCIACVLTFSVLLPPKVDAQAAPCGVVEGVDYPIDVTDTLSQGYDDFALFRARFGGLHAGIDIGFNRRGEPVRSAARGRVTYSDINGWDTEKGVVIVEHVFPDGDIRYSLYGHMEQSDAYLFPPVGTCVERGSILGTIGWPSRGLPHLHFEFRDFLPNDGGPGYSQVNPLTLGWFHPFDFTMLWRARLNPATTGYATFQDYPILPPVLLDTGLLVMANGDRVRAYTPPTTPLWDIQLEGVITGLAGLPGGRVIAHSSAGQAIQVQDGRITASWTVAGRDEPFMLWNETLAFVTADAGLTGYTPTGQLLWSVAGDGEIGRIISFQSGDAGFAIAHRFEGQTRWRAIDAAGNVVWDEFFQRTPTFAPTTNGWLLLDGMRVLRIAGGGSSVIGDTGVVPGRTSAITSDGLGSIYIYAADSERTLLAFNPDGSLRWRAQYPITPQLAPLMGVGAGCLLYTLDDDGMLNVFNATNGALVSQLQVYAGGVQNTHPRARLLRVDDAERILLGGGFLSMLALNGVALGGEAYANCLLG